jgi:2,3-bisphosphoglycerate-independent phosphoglycerate mutase
MKSKPYPLTLIILDGWGYREDPQYNAIASANKPFWDKLWTEYPHTLISGSGKCVGLPQGQMGNSEVGHLNMGAGRVVYQDLTRIDLAICDGSFFTNEELEKTCQKVKENDKALHIFGLISPGGVHSHETHIFALLDYAKKNGLKKVYVHAFLDGRDTPPQSAEASLAELSRHGKIISLIGRYYAMDRDKRMERTQKAYDLVTKGSAEFHADTALQGLEMAYARGETDEFVQATTIGNEKIRIEDNDAVIFMNFRADRARQLTRAFVDSAFDGFKRAVWPQVKFVTLTEYDKTLQLPVLFPKISFHNILGEYLSEKGLHQLRIAETEKYAHVTFFFNGGIEKPYPLEDRILISSPKVATYDLQPEMSAREMTDRLIAEIPNYDVIICNFANPDMVGHTGNFPATVKAIEVIDECLAKIIPAIQAAGGEVLITADHGNAELMFDNQTKQPHTAHTHELVPLLYIGRKAIFTKSNGVLSDIAPTMLYLLDLPSPPEMTGESLLQLT